MERPDLTVVIVNFNALAHLHRCLTSLEDGARGLRWEAIVVDNASRERGVERLEREFSNVRVIRRAVNGGFAVGVNTGVAAARAGVVMLLNPDTVVRPGALTSMCGYLREHPDIGVLGPRIENPDGTLQLSCRGFPTVWTGLFNRYSLLTRLLPGNRFSSGYLMTDWDHRTMLDVDWLSGAAMMIPVATFARAGHFDEAYFFAIEDVDFCRRVHDAGLRVVYFPHAEVTHEIGGSSRTAPNRVILARHRGMWRYYRRHLRPRAASLRRALLDAAMAAGISVRCVMQLTTVNGARALGSARTRQRPAPAFPRPDA
jgi:GT2 family glycosyltransferase